MPTSRCAPSAAMARHAHICRSAQARHTARPGVTQQHRAAEKAGELINRFGGRNLTRDRDGFGLILMEVMIGRSSGTTKRIPNELPLFFINIALSTPLCR
jgi:hypothetical protein